VLILQDNRDKLSIQEIRNKVILGRVGVKSDIRKIIKLARLIGEKVSK